MNTRTSITIFIRSTILLNKYPAPIKIDQRLLLPVQDNQINLITFTLEEAIDSNILEDPTQEK